MNDKNCKNNLNDAFLPDTDFISEAEKIDLAELFKARMNHLLIHLNEMDRKRIARELHDSTIQNMVCLIHKTELTSRYIDLDPIRAKLEIESMNKMIKESIEELRNLVYELRPMSFDDLGFEVSLRQYLDELDHLYDNEIEYYIQADFSNIKEDYLLTIYRVIKECCINSMKHSGGGKLTVNICEDKRFLLIDIADNGIGFDLSEKVDSHHFGIQILKDRIEFLNGQLQIDSKLNEGYRTQIKIPLDHICYD